MRLNPKDNVENLFFYQLNTNYYSSLEYLYKFVKEGVLKSLLPPDFKVSEYHTGITSTELKSSNVGKNDKGNLSDDEIRKKYSRPQNSVGMNIVLDTASPQGKLLSSITLTSNRMRQLHSYPILIDNLFSLKFLPNKFAFNVDINIFNEDVMSIENLLGYIYSRIPLESFTYLDKSIILKMVVNKEFLSILNLIYPELSTEDFLLKLENISNGSLTFNEDLVSEGDTYFPSDKNHKVYGNSVNANFTNDPLVKMTALSSERNMIRLSLRIECQLPNHIFFNCQYSLTELMEMSIASVELNSLDGLTEEQKIKAINFDKKFVNENRHLFKNITNEQFQDYFDGKLIFHLVDENLDNSLFQFLGMCGGDRTILENLEKNFELAPDEEVVNQMFDAVKSKSVDYSVNYDKIKTVVYNTTSFEKEKLRIDNEVVETFIKAQQKNLNDDFLVVVLDSNGHEIHYTIENDENLNFVLVFGEKLNTMISINCFRKKGV